MDCDTKKSIHFEKVADHALNLINELLRACRLCTQRAANEKLLSTAGGFRACLHGKVRTTRPASS
jgi:hypothetical protein